MTSIRWMVDGLRGGSWDGLGGVGGDRRVRWQVRGRLRF